MKFNTLLLHGKAVGSYPDHSLLPQIAQVTAFAFDSPEQQEKVFAHKAMGYAYSRIGNPTIAAFERRINELEGGNGCVACSSGMAALSSALLNLLCAGDEIITASNLYGGTVSLFHDLEKFGIKTHFVKHLIPEEIEPVINEHTKVIFGELISNPSLEVIDVEKVSSLAHQHGIPLMIDSTTATPYIAQPLKLGADIVVHSTSKYINGGGNSLGGVIIDGGKFPWDFSKHTALKEYSQYGKMAFLIRLRNDVWENIGSCAAPFNAYLNTIGIETLGLRMERICDNANKLAHALKENGVSVRYLGLEDHPCNALCKSELKGYGGGILTFRAGSKEKAYEVLNKLKCAIIASNIGDIRTLAIHPASTIYVHCTKEEQEKAGVYEDTIRVSVGIEDSEDLIEDFLQAINNE
ncbi:aminotransferase class V-fold PLP-dependent enzyme [Kandleria sp.]|uniref:aminotransferase class V-fold PLP-dependent enzyme n=1 Tax=Kandleria sp. TaxID=2774291 RepID=UPI001B6BF14E|nr:aminotransferase class V-fold PLP-dependent enzyme [Kandleria sp.]MBP3275954.1 O-acetylhomoserine aminocarboxypropyltransferase/cysteine synthase [Kandleria sp.]